MRIKFFVLFATLILLPSVVVYTPGYCEEEAGASPESLVTAIVVTSTPSHAEVKLKGSLRVRGITPFLTSSLPPGEYKLRVFKKGYEPSSKSLILLPDNKTEISIKLHKKSRLKTGIRSLIFPGFGQRYAGYSGKGWLFTASELIALGGLGYLKWKYGETVEGYNAVRERYKNATYIEDIQRYREEMIKCYNDAEDYFEYLQFSIYVALGIWVSNLLDAVIFHPVIAKDTERVSIYNKGIQSVWFIQFNEGRSFLGIRYVF